MAVYHGDAFTYPPTRHHIDFPSSMLLSCLLAWCGKHMFGSQGKVRVGKETHRIARIQRNRQMVCFKNLVNGQNSVWLRNCYILLHSGMDFQWILEAQSTRPAKVSPPSKVEFSLGKSDVLAWKCIEILECARAATVCALKA